MPIKWSARQVAERLDQMDKVVNQLEPILDELKAEVLATTNLPNLPEYMKQPLKWLGSDAEYAIVRLRERIGRIRGYIPKNDLAKEQRRFQLWLDMCDGDKDKAETAMTSGFF